MADIRRYTENIRKAIYGKEVRGSLADGIEAINNEVEDSTEIAVNVEQRQDSVEKQFEDVQQNATSVSPSDIEIVAGRTNTKTGENYQTIGQRLDDENEKVTQQLADIAINVKLFGASLDGYTDDTEALKKALIYLDSLGGGKLLIPVGTMVVRGGGLSREDYSGLSLENIHNITIEGISTESAIMLQRDTVNWGNISDIIFRKIKFTTDKEYISSNRLSVPKWSFSNFKNIQFEDCSADNWGLISNTESSGEILAFNALEQYFPLVYGRVHGNSGIVRVLNCDFIGGEKLDGVYQRQTQFAVRFYTEFSKDDGVYQLKSTIKNMIVSDCTFKGFNWQPIEFAGVGTIGGLVKDSFFYDNGITWAEADKGARDIIFDNCIVDGLYGDIVSGSSNHARGISIQGIINGDFMRKSKNIQMYDITVRNIKSRGDAIHLGWVDGFVLRNIKVAFETRFKSSNAIRLKPTVANADVKDIKIENAYYGIYEDNVRREDYVNLGVFDNIDLGNIVGFALSLYEGQVANHMTLNRLKAHFKNIKGYSSLTDDSPLYTVDVSCPHMLQLRGGGASFPIILEDFNVELSSSNPDAAFGIFDIFEVRLINCSALRVPRFTKAGKVNNVTRLMIKECNEAIFDMQNVTPHLNNSAFLTSFPNSSGATPKGFLYSDKKPTTTRVYPGQIVYNTHPVPGNYLGWTYISLSAGWKGFGGLESQSD